jgi:hypothetical protein
MHVRTYGQRKFPTMPNFLKICTTANKELRVQALEFFLNLSPLPSYCWLRLQKLKK